MDTFRSKRQSDPKAPSRGLHKDPAPTRIHWDSETVAANDMGATLAPRRPLSQNPPVDVRPKSEMSTITQLTLNDGRHKKKSEHRGRSFRSLIGSLNKLGFKKRKSNHSPTKIAKDTRTSNLGPRLPGSNSKEPKGPESEWKDTYGPKEFSDRVGSVICRPGPSSSHACTRCPCGGDSIYDRSSSGSSSSN